MGGCKYALSTCVTLMNELQNAKYDEFVPQCCASATVIVSVTERGMRIADNGLSAYLLTVTIFKLKITSCAGIRSVSTWRWQSSSSMALQNGENKEKTSHHSMLEP